MGFAGRLISVGSGAKKSSGAETISAADEIERVIPVIKSLVAQLPDTLVSIDTYKAAVAQAALEAGAHIVSGLDPENIAESVETVVKMKWGARYDFCEDISPSSVVINVLRSQITNYF